MYHPRRTTEFHENAYEDGGIISKRQTRGRAAVTPSPMPGSTRQSRQGQPMSLERDRGTLLGNATPLRKCNTPAERTIALHTDKKWVQEQSQLISDYLQEMLPYNSIPGLTQDFFSRSSGLRQMSTKQFVGIINFFIHYISPSRITVGTNHIEDIMKALQKLNYPHQVNKSWLMTPTTQHSFGHVIVMLDFLKDFAPPSPSMQMTNCDLNDFPFMETSEQPSYVHNTGDSMALSTTQAARLLDEEVNAQIFVNAADGFVLWNIHKNDECIELQIKTGDKLISKRCDLPDSAALDADIERQQYLLQELEQQLAHTSVTKKEQRLEQLCVKEQHLSQELLALKANTADMCVESGKLEACGQQASEDITSLFAQLAHLKLQVAHQKYTLDQYEAMKVQLTDLQNEAEIYERQQRELVERNLSQQVMLSRGKKQLLDKLEQFNAHVRELHYTGICSESEAEQLELALPIKQSGMQARGATMQRMCSLIEKQRAQHEQRRQQLKEERAGLSVITTIVESKLNALNVQTKTLELQLTQLQTSHKTKQSMWSQHQEELDDRQHDLAAQLEQFERHCVEHDNLLVRKKQQTHEILKAAEARQQELLQSRAAFLNESGQLLMQAEQNLRVLNSTLENNKTQLAQTKQQINLLQLPAVLMPHSA